MSRQTTGGGEGPFAWFDSLVQDLRYAWRGFRRSPGFALTVAGTIGLGLGLNVSLFAVLNTYVFRTVEVRDPDSLYEVWWELKDGTWRATWPQFEALRREGGMFADVAAYRTLSAPLDGWPASGAEVSENYLALLGPRMAAGRFIQPGDTGVVVLSSAAWQNAFGADPGMVGRTMRLRGRVVTVVGVAAPGFDGIGEMPLDFWVKAEGSRSDVGEEPSLRLLVRLRRGVSAAATRDAVFTWAVNATRGFPAERRAVAARIVSRATPIEYSPLILASFSPVFVAFGLVFAIACANVSNMMLARALSRQREMRIRTSLGAGRGRLVRQLLTESLLLAAPAAAAGVVVSAGTLRGATWLLRHTLPAAAARVIRIPSIEIDGRVLAFVLLSSVVAALAAGLVPAMYSARVRLVDPTRGDLSSDRLSSRLRGLLVFGQVTVCTLLAVSSGVALHSEQRLTGQNIHMRTEGVFDVVSNATVSADAVNRLRTAIGIEGVAAVWRSPIFHDLVQVSVRPSGAITDRLAGYNFVSPEYFALLHIPLVRGRLFTAEETDTGAGVVVISEATAREFFPGKEALGEMITIPAVRQADRRSDRLPTFSSARVVGIVGDVVSGFGTTMIDPSYLYFPTTAGVGPQSLLVAARRGGDGGQRDVQAAWGQIDPDKTGQINPLGQVHAVMVYPFRIAFWIATFLGVLAIALTVSGIYGVLSHSVSQRTKEIGIRMALGASTPAVVGMVVWQSMKLVAAGAVAGTGLALLFAPVFANRVQVVQPYDPIAYLGAILLIAATALAASARPAQRAAAVDPSVALRGD